MTLHYDHQIFCEQQFGGISRYFYELIKGASKIEGITTILDVKFSDNYFLQKLQPDNNCLTKSKFKGKKDLVRFINYLNTKIITKSNHFDIFHPTYFNDSSIHNARGKPIVITVFDMIDEKFNSTSPNFKKLIKERSKIIKAANLVLCISESTRNDVIEYFNLDPKIVKVTYLANSFKKSQIEEVSIFNQKSYILYIGSRNGVHKNFINFTTAMSKVLSIQPELELVFGGGGEFTLEEKRIFQKLKIQNRVCFAPITTDKSLISLYKNASLFVYPSIYEGFGLPILEAFSCKTPCVISKGSSIEEVGSNAASYFNPLDTESIASNILSTYLDKKLQKELILRGLEREKDFSWNKMVHQTIDFYKTLL